MGGPSDDKLADPVPVNVGVGTDALPAFGAAEPLAIAASDA
jgi:hypothetical protein